MSNILNWGKETITWAGGLDTNSSSRKGECPLAIVNHMSVGSKTSVINWFTSKSNNNSSAHFLVCKNGEVFQFVSMKKSAWCNGLTSGIAYATSELVKEKGQNISVNRYTISIEHEGGMEDDGALTSQQLESTILLHEYIMKFVSDYYGHEIKPNRKFILGHYEIDSKRKPTCPGPAYPFNVIIKRLGGKGEDLPFNDIADHWVKDIIIEALNLKLISGNGTDNFYPNDKATRAESITMMISLYHLLMEVIIKKIDKGSADRVDEIFEKILKALDN